MEENDMAKLIFCYQFECVDDANEFVSKLYLYYIMSNHELPIIESNLDIYQVMVEGFNDDTERKKQLLAMNYLAEYFNGKAKSVSESTYPVLEKTKWGKGKWCGYILITSPFLHICLCYSVLYYKILI